MVVKTTYLDEYVDYTIKELYEKYPNGVLDLYQMAIIETIEPKDFYVEPEDND